MSDDTKRWIDEGVNQVTPGFVMTARRIKQYHDILIEVGVPELYARIAIEEWVKADARYGVEIMLHGAFAQQHAAIEAQQKGETT